MTINKNEAESWVKVIQAFIDGKEIQFKQNHYDGTSEWVPLSNDNEIQITFKNNAVLNPDEYYRILG